MQPKKMNRIQINPKNNIAKEIPLKDISQIKQNSEELQPQKEDLTSSNNEINKSHEQIVVNSVYAMKKWESYENSVYEMPFSPVSLGSSYYLYRWRFISPFHKKIIFGWTFGEILVLLILLAVPAVSMPITYCNPCDNTLQDGTQNTLYTQAGTAAQFPMLFCFLFAMKNSIWTFLFGITFERQLLWHKILAVITAGMALYHGLLAAQFNITGWITFACMGGLLFFSLPPFRRKVFEFFYRTHWILFIGVAVFGLIHGAGVGVIGFAGNIIDFILRKIIINRNKKNSLEVLAVRLPANVVRITFKKDSFNYKAGQYAFICVPELSYLEWHPFSLSSSPHQDTVTLHIRVLGDWTSRLATVVGTTEKKLVILIDGPYGNPSIDIDSDKYNIFLMISGGIGITPLQSMTNELLEQHSRGRPLKKIFFVWSVRDHFMISDVQSYDVKYLENNLPKQLPYSFQPDLLEINNPRRNSIKETDSILDSRFHLTQLKFKDEQQLQDCNINPDKMPYLKFGRPNLAKLFEEVQKKAIELGEQRVAVLCCGPSQLVEEVAAVASSVNPIPKKVGEKSGQDCVQFDVHEELFEF